MNSFGVQYFEEAYYSNDIKKLNDQMKKWDYGYISNGKRYTGKEIDKDEFKSYKLMGHDKVEKYKIGTCWDYTSYEDYWFKKHNIPHQCWYFQANRGDNHAWLSYKENGKVIAFEASWKSYTGLHVYNNEDEMLKDYISRSIKDWKAETGATVKVGGYFVTKFNQFNIDGMDPYDYMYKVTKYGTFVKGDRDVYTSWKDNREMLQEDTKEETLKGQFYRIVYDINGKSLGIYEAAKKNMSWEEWKEFKSKKEVTWLPVPKGEYGKRDRSYFTKEGWVIFKKKTLPLLKPYLKGGIIVTISDNDITGIVKYRDRYQVVLESNIIVKEDTNMNNVPWRIKPEYVVEPLYLKALDEYMKDNNLDEKYRDILIEMHLKEDEDYNPDDYEDINDLGLSEDWIVNEYKDEIMMDHLDYDIDHGIRKVPTRSINEQTINPVLREAIKKIFN